MSTGGNDLKLYPNTGTALTPNGSYRLFVDPNGNLNYQPTNTGSVVGIASPTGTIGATGPTGASGSATNTGATGPAGTQNTFVQYGPTLTSVSFPSGVVVDGTPIGYYQLTGNGNCTGNILVALSTTVTSVTTASFMFSLPLNPGTNFSLFNPVMLTISVSPVNIQSSTSITQQFAIWQTTNLTPLVSFAWTGLPTSNTVYINVAFSYTIQEL